MEIKVKTETALGGRDENGIIQELSLKSEVTPFNKNDLISHKDEIIMYGIEDFEDDTLSDIYYHDCFYEDLKELLVEQVENVKEMNYDELNVLLDKNCVEGSFFAEFDEPHEEIFKKLAQIK